MRYLGVDWGKVHIGLAVSEGELATPLKELTVHSLEDALSQIARVVEEEGIWEIVIGLPESGEARDMAQKGIQGLIDLGLAVSPTDETLTSHNTNGDHKKAAALILQEYLDNQ